MKASDFHKARDAGHFHQIDPADVVSYGERLAYKRQIALPILPLCRLLSFNASTSVHEPGGGVIATLLCLTRFPDRDPEEFSEPEYLAYLSEVAPERIGASYKFEQDYIVVSIEDLARYEARFKKSSGLWGGFVHVEDGPQGFASRLSNVDRIDATDEIDDLHSIQQECLLLASMSERPPERYLRLYHLIEFQFDLHLVKKIRGLPDSLEGIEAIKSKFQLKELEMMELVLSERVRDLTAIIIAMNRVDHAAAFVRRVFFGSHHEGFPVKSLSELQQICLNGGFDHAYLVKQVKSLSDKSPAVSLAKHRAYIVKVAAFLIYRMRCAIVHRRSGGQIVSVRDEQFILEFGEPLLRAVLLQIHQK